jgi:hypothetical protein
MDVSSRLLLIIGRKDFFQRLTFRNRRLLAAMTAYNGDQSLVVLRLPASGGVSARSAAAPDVKR